MSQPAAAPPEVDVRPLRADARRNRERIVRAARAVFADQGRDAQIDDVARRAKVGVGTVYRHFPTKEALIEALAVDKFERLEAFAREALEADDPWEGFAGLIRRGAEQMASDRGLFEVMTAESCILERAARAREDLEQAAGELMRRAQATGALRADVTPTDLGMVMCGIGAAVHAGPPNNWERHVALVLDGMRAPGATPLPA